MIAKLAYLTSPSPGRFIMNFQSVDTLGNDVLLKIEISRGHLANIIIDGASFSLRETSTLNRVTETASPEESRNERAGA